VASGIWTRKNELGQRREFLQQALDNREKEVMIKTIQKHIAPDQDRAAVYSLCAACKGQSVSLGAGGLSDEPEVIVI
jgi:hypothetical protein